MKSTSKIKRGKMLAKAFLRDDRGQVQMANQAVGVVVALMVAAITAAFLVPVGISELVSVDTTNWSDGASSMWDILDVVVVLAIFLFFISIALSSANQTQQN